MGNGAAATGGVSIRRSMRDEMIQRHQQRMAYITDLDIHGFRSVGLYYCTEYHYYSICRGRRFPRAHVEANNAPSMQQNLLQ
jgi:hypothetical protein